MPADQAASLDLPLTTSAPGTAPPATRRIELGPLLGRGGYGEVYKGRLTRGEFGRDVAVKLLLHDVEDREALQRAIDEARLLAELHHEAIPGVLDVLQVDQRQAIVSEYIAGIDLKLAMGLPPRAVLDVGAQIADALDAAFNSPIDRPLQLVHRDVKPDNIRLTHRGKAKLLDFGIAKATGRKRSASTGTASVVGTFAYAAPERFEGDDGPAGDVYSLGIVLLERLVGRKILQTNDAFEIYRLHYAGKAAQTVAAALREVDDPRIQRLLTEMTREEPESRPDALTVSNRCRDLAPALGGTSLAEWCRRHAPEWPRPTKAGELTGSAFVEGVDGLQLVNSDSLARGISGPASLSTTGSGTMSRPLIIASVLGLPAMALIGVIGLLLVLIIVVLLTGRPTEPTPVAVAPPPAPATRVVVDTAVPRPRPAPEPVEAEEPVAPAPAPRPRPRPRSQPDPAPAPAGAAIRDVGTVPFVLVGSGGERPSGEVPPGTWTVRVSFGPGDTVDALKLTVDSGDNYQVKCTRFSRSCKPVAQ